MSEQKLRAGWLPDTDLSVFLREHRDELASVSHVVIGCVDSDTHPGGQRWAQSRLTLHDGWAPSLDPLVIPGQEAVQLVVDGEVFSGFDEVWLCDRLPQSAPPSEAHIVCPARLDEEALPTGLAEWMHSSGGFLGLGDGFGLNYVVRGEALGLGDA